MTTPPRAHLLEERLSPELVLVDPTFVGCLPESGPGENALATRGDQLRIVDEDVRAATRRICELSDVNPPRRRLIGVWRLSGVAALWLEVVVLATTSARVGLP